MGHHLKSTYTYSSCGLIRPCLQLMPLLWSS